MRLLSIQELPQSGRVKLVFETRPSSRHSPYLLADFGLYSGMELSEEDYQALLAAAGKASARARAVRIVAAAGVSERELQKRLVQKGEEAADAKEAVGWLKELHLLDDGETARQLVASAAAKGYGKSRIKNILYEKGIPQEFWDDALADLPEMDDAIDRFLARRWQGKVPDEKEVNGLWTRSFAAVTAGRISRRVCGATAQIWSWRKTRRTTYHDPHDRHDLAWLRQKSGQCRTYALAAAAGRL